MSTKRIPAPETTPATVPTAAAANGLVLGRDEAAEIAALTGAVAARYPVAEDPALHRDLPLLAAELPARVRRFLRAFQLGESAGHCLLHGHLLDSERIGPTPSHWRGRERPGPEFPEEILLLLYGALLGEPFGWATQQDGHFVNDVFPIREFAHQLLGTGSQARLTLHTEDAFHPFRADFLLLGALRNPYRAPTTIAEPDVGQLPEAIVDVLMQPRFTVVPDTSHLARNNSVRDGAEREYFDRIEAMLTADERVAILSGDRTSPTLRFDETYMSAPADDPDALRAYTWLRRHLLRRRGQVILDAGDVLILDNGRVVHGRDPFAARYDGTDRWLKRVNVTCDLRKSSGMRGRLGPRLIG